MNRPTKKNKCNTPTPIVEEVNISFDNDEESNDYLTFTETERAQLRIKYGSKDGFNFYNFTTGECSFDNCQKKLSVFYKKNTKLCCRTSNFHSHLKSIHKWVEKKENETLEFNDIERYKVDLTNEESDALDNRLALHIAHNYIPFNQLSSPYFIALFPEGYSVPTKDKMVMTILPRVLGTMNSKIQNDLCSMEYISFTHDCWTNVAYNSFLAITAHGFVEDHNSQTLVLKSYLIAIQQLTERHTSEYLGSIITDTCKRWNINESKVLFGVSDNANAALGTSKAAGLNPIRCAPHSIQLALQPLFQAKSKLVSNESNTDETFPQSYLFATEEKFDDFCNEVDNLSEDEDSAHDADKEISDTTTTTTTNTARDNSIYADYNKINTQSISNKASSAMNQIKKESLVLWVNINIEKVDGKENKSFYFEMIKNHLSLNPNYTIKPPTYQASGDVIIRETRKSERSIADKQSFRKCRKIINNVLRLISFFRKSSVANTLTSFIKLSDSNNKSTKFKTACVTRWGSTLGALKSFRSKYISILQTFEYLIKNCTKRTNNQYQEFYNRMPVGQDLQLLDDIIKILDMFDRTSIFLSKEKQPSLDQVFISISELKDALQNTKDISTQTGIDLSLDLLANLQERSDKFVETKEVLIATFLNPNHVFHSSFQAKGTDQSSLYQKAVRYLKEDMENSNMDVHFANLPPAVKEVCEAESKDLNPFTVAFLPIQCLVQKSLLPMKKKIFVNGGTNRGRIKNISTKNS